MDAESRWRGASLGAIYGGGGPWALEHAPVRASHKHRVLFQLPVPALAPPQPHFTAGSPKWDHDHVQMPHARENIFPVTDEAGLSTLKSRWKLIKEALNRPIRSVDELEAAVFSYNSRKAKFHLLHHLFDEVLEEEERDHFFCLLLPSIVQRALQLPDLLPGDVPLLKEGTYHSLSLSQLQISSLLANAFLCTFPWKRDCSNYPGVNFNRLFECQVAPPTDGDNVLEKLKCILHYFRRVCGEAPVGVVTFSRNHVAKSCLPRWDTCDASLRNTLVHISCDGMIEDQGQGMLQVDFANRLVGGGVLGWGCVQEEIRFVINPELIVSRLFTEKLGPTDALVIIGSERYSNYEGYARSFRWTGDHRDGTPRDSSSRRRTSIVAIDAVHLSEPLHQFSQGMMLRELNKAYAGFYEHDCAHPRPVATGNWGCGAFRGDARLKFLLQLMAATAARRHLVYFTFGDAQLMEALHGLLQAAERASTIGNLWRLLSQFRASKRSPEELEDFLTTTTTITTTTTSTIIPLAVSFKRKPSNSCEVDVESGKQLQEDGDDDDDGRAEEAARLEEKFLLQQRSGKKVALQTDAQTSAGSTTTVVCLTQKTISDFYGRQMT